MPRRIVAPDCIRAFLSRQRVSIRNPDAVRPWQHVLEPLNGYLVLAEKLYGDGPKYSGGWNFGPEDHSAKSVEWLVRALCRRWNPPASYDIVTGEHPHEASTLKLDCSKAKTVLGWSTRWELPKAVDRVVEWYRTHQEKGDLLPVCLRQIREYEHDQEDDP